MNLLISNAYMIHSILALERGASHVALSHAKQCLRLVRRAWTTIENQSQRKSIGSDSSKIEVEKLADDVSHMSISTVTLPGKSMSEQIHAGSSFWALVTPLFRSLNHLSTVFSHHGMFQETVYYAEQAYKLVKGVGTEAHLAMASASLGNIWLRAGVLDRGSEYLMEAKQMSEDFDKSRNGALLAYHLGNMHGLVGHSDEEMSAYGKAECMLETIGMVDYIQSLEKVAVSPDSPDDTLSQQMSELVLTKRKVLVSRKTLARPKAAPKTISRRKGPTRAKSPVEAPSSVAENCPQLASLASMITRQKARALMAAKRFGEALAMLQGVEISGLSQFEVVDHGLAMAKQLLLQSLEQMNVDPIYSVLQDSTISFPSVAGLAKSLEKHGDKLSVTKASPPGKTRSARGGRERARSKSPAPDSFFDKLRQAQEYLTDIQSLAIAVAPMSVVHVMSTLLNSVAILLSAAGQIKGKSLAHPGLASSSIGMPLPAICLIFTDFNRKRKNYSYSKGTQGYSGRPHDSEIRRHLLATNA